MADDEIIIKIGTDVDKTQIQELESEIEQLKKNAESVDSSGFDGLSAGADTATDSVESLSESLDGLSMIAVGDVLQQYGDQAEQMAQQVDEANISFGQLAIQTGVTEPQLRNMISSITNATFPRDEALMYVKSLDQIGVSANNLGSSATDLDKINDAFGLGADTVNHLGQELSVLGVDMNNVGSSFNALAYANANTVGGMQNYYTFLRRYDSQFKELGLNVDQASVLIAGATQKFGGGRAALSGLSSILKESNGDLSAMEQQLGLTAGSLTNASQLTGQYSGQLEQMADEERQHKTILQEIGAAWEDLTNYMGGVLSPVGSLIGAFGQFIGVGTQLNGTLELMSKFGGLAGKLNIATVATKAYAVAQGILNFVMSMNPIMLVVIALAALVAGLVWAYQNVDWFREAVNNAWASITQLANTIWSIFKPAFDMISNIVSSFTSKLGLEKDNWINSVLSFLVFIATLPVQLGVIFWNAIAKALGFGDNFVQNMVKGAQDAVNGFINWITQLPGKLSEELNKMLDMAGEFAMKIADKLSMGGASAVAGWVSGSGEHSPGYMYEAFVGELEAMEKAPSDFDLSGGMADAGSSMVKSFNPNIGSSSTGVVGTNNITINIESVDNEDRIQEIVEAVEEALVFDNLTAGRTV